MRRANCRRFLRRLLGEQSDVATLCFELRHLFRFLRFSCTQSILVKTKTKPNQPSLDFAKWTSFALLVSGFCAFGTRIASAAERAHRGALVARLALFARTRRPMLSQVWPGIKVQLQKRCFFSMHWLVGCCAAGFVQRASLRCIESFARRLSSTFISVSFFSYLFSLIC